MRFVFYTNSVSAHQLPLAREIVRRLGSENYRYIYTGDALQGGGQEVAECEPWVGRVGRDECTKECLEESDVLVSGLRELDLFEHRMKKGLKTFYYGERWFKPIEIGVEIGVGVGDRCRGRLGLPGKLRMLVPGYRRMAKRFVAWMKSDPKARCLAIGPWAKKDMLWLGVPEEKIVDWGYFVEPSHLPPRTTNHEPRTTKIEPCRSGEGEREIRILWVGRMLDWKRVDTIVRAVAFVNGNAEERRNGFGERCGGGGGGYPYFLTLVGDGPEKERLQNLAAKLQKKIATHHSTPTSTPYTFLPSVSITEIRGLMHAHDIYVLASNEQEGWGAALNEAMEEGMTCLGTYEAGASAALLPRSNLFHSGDWRALAKLLVSHSFTNSQQLTTNSCIAKDYTPSGAADKLMELIK